MYRRLPTHVLPVTCPISRPRRPQRQKSTRMQAAALPDARPSLFHRPRFRGLMSAGSVTDDPRSLQSQQCPPVGTDCKTPRATNDVCLRHSKARGPKSRHLIPNPNCVGHSCTGYSLGPVVRSFDDIGHLNMDSDGEGDWATARHLAKRQTQHEWCRLLHLAREQDPTNQAAGRLLGHWVKPHASPHIPGTACAQQAVRRHTIEIWANPGTAAPRDVRFVLFRGDFTNSARATVKRGQTAALRLCANENEDVVASLVPRASAGTALVVKMPNEARSWTVRQHADAFDATFTIKVTPNTCSSLL